MCPTATPGRRTIAMALEFGATDIVSERGDEGIAGIKELTRGIGADPVPECDGMLKLLTQAMDECRAIKTLLRG